MIAERPRDASREERRTRETRQVHFAFVGYLCALCFVAGMYIGTLIGG